MQGKIEECIDQLELLTKQVSQFEMFSDNEQYDELSSSNMRFLLLPAYLGFIITRKQFNSDPNARMIDLNNAEVSIGRLSKSNTI